jgi:hypothetical protein
MKGEEREGKEEEIAMEGKGKERRRRRRMSEERRR